MRIVIDLQAAQVSDCHYGVGHYSINLAIAMARNSGTHEIWILLSDQYPESIPRIRHVFYGVVPHERIVVFTVPSLEPGSNQKYIWLSKAAGLIREYCLAELQPDLIIISNLFLEHGVDAISTHKLYGSKTPIAALLYSFNHITPNEYNEINATGDSKSELLKKIYYTDLILTSSNCTQDLIIDELGDKVSNVVNVSSGIDDETREFTCSSGALKRLCKRYNINKPYLVIPIYDDNRIYAVRQIIDAYGDLPGELLKSHMLVFTEIPDDETKRQIIQYNINSDIDYDNIVLLDHISNIERLALYTGCTIFIDTNAESPISIEILEAMACGSPIISKKKYCNPEVVSDDVTLFVANSKESIAAAIHKVLTDERFRYSLSKYSNELTKRFTWERSAAKAFKALESIYTINNIEGVECTLSADSQMNYSKLINSMATLSEIYEPTNDDYIALATCIAINQPTHSNKQILVDISELVQRDAKSGIQRVTRSILFELLTNPPDGYNIQPVYYDGKCFRYARYFVGQYLGIGENKASDSAISFSRGDIFLGLDLTAHVMQETKCIIRSLNLLGVKIYYIVYDLLPLKHPEWWPYGFASIIRQWLEISAELVTGYVCISRSAAKELREWLDAHQPNRVEPLQIKSFHLGADIGNKISSLGFPPNAAEVISIMKSRFCFLMVGTIEPRKGHSQVISAFSYLWKNDYNFNLIIVGKEGWLVNELIGTINNHPMINKKLFWLEGVSDEYLECVYSESDCLIAASEGEGFGLPLVEAALHDLPILARDIPVFREVAGQHAYYFSGVKPKDLYSAILKWFSLYEVGRQPESNKIPILSWKNSANSLLSVIID